ncbi:hypothetical protein F4811DRAFT_553410 [Daldinia bambusicola]|nr:hypothetical protein F4811DRAFT_553410 [Daldinia bambusicola]
MSSTDPFLFILISAAFLCAMNLVARSVGVWRARSIIERYRMGVTVGKCIVGLALLPIVLAYVRCEAIPFFAPLIVLAALTAGSYLGKIKGLEVYLQQARPTPDSQPSEGISDKDNPPIIQKAHFQNALTESPVQNGQTELNVATPLRKGKKMKSVTFADPLVRYAKGGWRRVRQDLNIY